MPCLSRVIEEQVSLRLDRYVSEVLCLLSRSQIKARNLMAKINGKDVKLSRLVKQGDFLEICWEDCPPVDIVPQDIPLDIVYEDARCIVVNKAQGMVVHPGAGNRQNTLANALYFRRLNKGAGEVKGSARPGIVHRLDKETSGIIIAAYDDEAHAYLGEQFKNRKTEKKYIAIVQGTPKETKGCIESYIARDPKNRKRFAVCAGGSSCGKNAVTFYKVIKSWKTHSLVLLRPRTGRTHQLRVHMRHLGNPILGDPAYGSGDKFFANAGLMLHSKSLAVVLPDQAERTVFSSGIPERFTAVMERLERMTVK